MVKWGQVACYACHKQKYLLSFGVLNVLEFVLT